MAKITGEHTPKTNLDMWAISPNANVDVVTRQHLKNKQVYIGGNSHLTVVMINGDVEIDDDARINVSYLNDNVRVNEQATIHGSVLSNSSYVHGQATLYSSRICDSSEIFGNAILRDSVVTEEVIIYGNADIRKITVSGCSHIFGKAKLINMLSRNYSIILEGSCKFGGWADISTLTTFESFVKKYGKDNVRVETNKIVLTNVWDMG